MEEGNVKEALKKCAVGFGTSEVVEEFAVEDGELKLVKRKVTRRDIPPDIKAVMPRFFKLFNRPFQHKCALGHFAESGVEGAGDDIVRLMQAEAYYRYPGV